MLIRIFTNIDMRSNAPVNSSKKLQIFPITTHQQVNAMKSCSVRYSDMSFHQLSPYCCRCHVADPVIYHQLCPLLKLHAKIGIYVVQLLTTNNFAILTLLLRLLLCKVRRYNLGLELVGVKNLESAFLIYPS